jgi:hypothetical protein
MRRLSVPISSIPARKLSFDFLPVVAIGHCGEFKAPAELPRVKHKLPNQFKNLIFEQMRRDL